MATTKGYIGLYRDYRVYIGVIYIGIMEKKMETTVIRSGFCLHGRLGL